jgi:hypothetical protein
MRNTSFTKNSQNSFDMSQKKFNSVILSEPFLSERNDNRKRKPFIVTEIHLRESENQHRRKKSEFAMSSIDSTKSSVS